MSGKVEGFKLAPKSYVQVMSQLSIEEGGLEDDLYVVSNEGTVQIEVEIVQNENPNLGPLVVELDPDETQRVARNDQLKETVLKITNKSDQEAVFSAEGGKLLSEELASMVQLLSEN